MEQKKPKTKDEKLDVIYGATIDEWLRRWDAGESVWTIEMGGLGPGYEQALQMAVVEVVRHLVGNPPTSGVDEQWWAATSRVLDDRVLRGPVVRPLGLSGAQWGAAVGLGINLYRQGPRVTMADPELVDRHIQVQRDFPGGR